MPGTVFSLFAPGLPPAVAPGLLPLASCCDCSATSAISIGWVDDGLRDVDRFIERFEVEACDVAGVFSCALSCSMDNFLFFRDPISDSSCGPSYISDRDRADAWTEFWLKVLALFAGSDPFDGVLEGLLNAPLAVSGVLDWRL